MEINNLLNEEQDNEAIELKKEFKLLANKRGAKWLKAKALEIQRGS